MPAQNRLTLDVRLVAREALRYTPAGIPALDCTLRHESQQREAGGERKVECDLAAVAFAEVAHALAKMPVDSALRCEGFIARRWRTGTSIALHIARFTELRD
ncbi:MAG TPA: primosomal replication protein N [Casimicrobiaceae bacterium]